MEDDRSNESEFQQTRKRRLSRVQTGDFINPSNKQNASSGNFDENLNNNSTEITIDEKNTETEVNSENNGYSSGNNIRSILTSDSNQNSPFWDNLRRKILIDLQRHFKRKVDHDRLISSLCK